MLKFLLKFQMICIKHAFRILRASPSPRCTIESRKFLRGMQVVLSIFSGSSVRKFSGSILYFRAYKGNNGITFKTVLVTLRLLSVAYGNDATAQLNENTHFHVE
jgi:hypothetical protein